MQGVGRDQLGTTERIKREREMHRMKLQVVEDLPKDVLICLLQVGRQAAVNGGPVLKAHVHSMQDYLVYAR
jgi:hypothetical protein